MGTLELTLWGECMNKWQTLLGLTCLIGLSFSACAYLFHKDTPVAQSPDLIARPSAAPKGSEAKTELSRRAAHLKSGMTPKQVFSVLQHHPDTVVNQQISEGLGEKWYAPPETLTFQWANGKDCSPVVVDFEPRPNLVVTGKDEGRGSCNGPSLFTKTFGKPCQDNKLCNIF